MRPGLVLIVLAFWGVGALTGATTASTKKRHSPKHSHHTARRNFQSTPSSERYREIQQALASHGYYNGPVDGNWNAGSVDALRRFQQDQNLPPDGKLNSLSLIAMGLGPQRAATSRPASPAIPPPPSSSTPPSPNPAGPATQTSSSPNPALPETSAAPSVPPTNPPPNPAEAH